MAKITSRGKLVLLGVVFLSSPWLWQIIISNLGLGFLVILASFFFFLLVIKTKTPVNWLITTASSRIGRNFDQKAQLLSKTRAGMRCNEDPPSAGRPVCVHQERANRQARYLEKEMQELPKETPEASGEGFIALVLVIFLVFFQWKTTQVASLTDLSNDEQRIQQIRFKEYPLIHFKVFNRVIWPPIGYWFEFRKELLVFSRISKNFFEAIDPGLYFFANHPRERVGLDETEKFAYPLLPFFLLGNLMIFSQPRQRQAFLLLILPLGLVSFVGHNNPLGPFSLMPFLAVIITEGISYLFNKIPTKAKSQRILFSLSLLLILIFNFFALGYV
jgi:hypothetical protein